MPHYSGPLLTRPLLDAMREAQRGGSVVWNGSLDLGRGTDEVRLEADRWQWRGHGYPWPERLKDRTVYYWDGGDFAPASRFGNGLYKLVPTEWGVPTFEIDGIKMLVSAQLSPMEDARRKVALVAPRGKQVLDTCGGMGYFAACCLEAGVTAVRSFEKSPEVLWLRTLNPWSPISRWPSRTSPMPRWTPCCTIRRASASPANCIRRRSTTTWRGCCAGVASCSTTPACPTG